MSENTKQTRCTVQYNMCAAHLVCMLTVISIRAYTVFQGLNLLFGQLSEEVVFSAVHWKDPLPATWFKPDGLRLEPQQPQ